ncbi:hypothetical protein [Kineococcus esterisolvens]|uniref:hypothetical protein n=1 Tax=unclassified Kineococcus TaxID=2621656 RepID=UPI003D7D5B14
MNQRTAVASWWAEADQATRRRALRLRGDEPLPEDMAVDLGMHGVTVAPLDRSPVDGRPVGYVPPRVLLEFLEDVRGRS